VSDSQGVGPAEASNSPVAGVRQRFAPLVVEDASDQAPLIERAFRRAGLPILLPILTDVRDVVGFLEGSGKFADPSRFYPKASFLLVGVAAPRRAGFDVVTTVRARTEWDTFPIVVLSRTREKKDLYRAYDLGANSYLEVPDTFDGLVETVRTLVGYWTLLNCGAKL